jgi:uncharacterized protein (TIGR02996 family)
MSVARKKTSDTASVGDVLEKALVKNPDDLGAHAAYADWLTQQGDPRGEFIQVQLALEDPGRSAKERKKLQKREKELLTKHQREWLGDLARFFVDGEGVPEYPPVVIADLFRFARGWLDNLVIPVLTGALARALGRAKQIRLLRNLAILDVEDFMNLPEEAPEVDFDQMEDAYPGLRPLSNSPYLGNIRVFQLGNQHQPGNDDYTYNSLHAPYIGLFALLMIQKMPKVEELYLNLLNFIDGQELFGLRTLRRLRVLQFCLGDSYPLKVLADNTALGQLTHLLFHPQAVEECKKSLISRSAVRALVRSRHLPRLTHLALHQTDMGDAGCTEIVRSGILGRLKVLDVSHGSMTDAGARILAGCPDLANLEFLDVSENGLTNAGIKVLKAVGIPVRADDQHDPDDDAYLFQGDWE